jgi:protein TonB
MTNDFSVKNRPYAKVVETAPPIYPTQAEIDGITGEVQLKFDVNPEGKAVNIAVTGSNPENIFDNSAKESLSKWVFLPKVENGIAVTSKENTIVLEFNLRN